MKVRYFTDTDTAYVGFSQSDSAETREINENIYIDLDQKGNLVGMTIEHASTQANISEISFLQDQQKAQQAAGAQGYDAYPETGDAYSLDEDVPVPPPQPRKLTPEEQLKRMKDAARQMEANKRRSQHLSRNAASPAREGRPAV